MCAYRFLIDVRWFKQWKKYVGYDEWETSMVGENVANPGPIDNSNLFKGDYLVHTWFIYFSLVFCRSHTTLYCVQHFKTDEIDISDPFERMKNVLDDVQCINVELCLSLTSYTC